MGSVSVSSCRCCMFVSCVHPVAILNAAFCMTFSLLLFFVLCSHQCTSVIKWSVRLHLK